MKLKTLSILSLILTTGLAAQAATDNRSQPAADAIFNEPTTAGGQQIMLGLGEMLASKFLTSPLTTADKIMATHAENIAEEEIRLLLAQDRPVSASIKSSLLEELTRLRMEGEKSLKPNAKEMQILEQRIFSLKQAEIITPLEKQAAIDIAKLNLANQRVNAILAAQDVGLLDKSIKVLQRGAVVLLATDAGSRVYIWNALSANPTLSPAAAYLKSLIK